MKRPSAQRGQAVVELAITSVMFVTVLLFGIYFAEAGFIGQKVQEAASYAMYDTTGRRVSDFKNGNLTGNFNGVYQPYGSLNGYKGSASAANALYKDFDGVLDNGNQLSQVMTSAQSMNVTCADDNGIGFTIGNIASGRPQAAQVENFLKKLYKNQGGLNCSAKATLQAINFPKAFLEQDKTLSKSELFDAQPLTICGAGKAKNGNCKGSYAVLTGDWALDQAQPNGNNNVEHHSLQDGTGQPMGTQKNPAFRTIVSDIYKKNGDSKQTPGNGFTRAQEMIQIGGGYTPAQVSSKTEWNDRKFLMSYAGEEDDFGQNMYGTTDKDNKNDTRYNTSGVYIKGWADPKGRQKAINKLKKDYKDCFLGIGREGCNK